MSTIKTRTFMFFNFLGGVSWVLGIGFAGYFFGSVLETFFGRLGRFQFRVVVIIIIAVALGSMIYRIYRKGLKGFLKN
jgi:membrane protein DedA with SNARE-associated domain